MRAVLVTLLVAVGCSRSSLANYYLLTPRTPSEAAKKSELSLGVGPILLPEYVDRDNIVTTAGAQQVELAESHLWAEPLDRNVERVIAESLSRLLGTDTVYIYPWASGTVDVQVGVRVTRLTGRLGGDVFLDAYWSIKRGDEPILTRRASLSRPAGEDYASFAAALSDMLGELCRQIAEAIPK